MKKLIQKRVYKYEAYINNLEYNIKQMGDSKSNRLTRATIMIECYKEMLSDLQQILNSTKQS